jgi:putative ABC transport system permease protein
LLVAMALNAVFVARLANQLPRTQQIHLDASVLGFTALISILASLLFGVAPALHSARSDVGETLKESGRGTSGRPKRAATQPRCPSSNAKRQSADERWLKKP